MKPMIEWREDGGRWFNDEHGFVIQTNAQGHFLLFRNHKRIADAAYLHHCKSAAEDMIFIEAYDSLPSLRKRIDDLLASAPLKATLQGGGISEQAMSFDDFVLVSRHDIRLVARWLATSGLKADDSDAPVMTTKES